MTEPWHRRWLHALEADLSVPGTPMQIARIYSDYAASRGRWADPSYTELLRQTHRTRDTIADAIRYLVARGWLRPRGDWKLGQEKSYDLVIPGQKRDRSGQSTSRASRPVDSNRSTQQTGSSRLSKPVPVEPVDRSTQPATTGRASRPEPVEPVDYIRLTSFTSLSPLSPPGLHAALAEWVPDVTERESDAIRQLIGRRPGVRSAAAVMRAEIQSGNGPDLVAQVRGVAAADHKQATKRRHEFQRGPTGWCVTCDQPEQAVAHRDVRVPID